jgi:hypothetical protein
MLKGLSLSSLPREKIAEGSDKRPDPNTPKTALRKVVDGNVPPLNPDADVALQKIASRLLDKKSS